MKQTVIDRYPTEKTYLGFGNLNDVFYSEDMTARNMEEFWVEYLKSRGYRHIIFYGEDGNKGAYCRDMESARFFFRENQDIPEEICSKILAQESEEEDDDAAETKGEETSASGRAASGRGASSSGRTVSCGGATSGRAISGGAAASGRRHGLGSMIRRPAGSHYRPGSLSSDASASSGSGTGGGSGASSGNGTAANNSASCGNGTAANSSASCGNGTAANSSASCGNGTAANGGASCGNGAAAGGTASSGTGSAVSASNSAAPARPWKFRFARRNMRLSEFLNLILPLMLEKDSHMAVIFYNIFTTDLSQFQSLRNCILDVWPKRDMENCCIFMAPDTAYDQDSLITSIQNLNLQSRFLIRRENQWIFNPRTCFRVGFPLEDEIKNLLRRYAVIGTEKKHCRVRFDYTKLDEIAEEIIFCSRSREKTADAPLELSFEYMKEIRLRVQNYIEKHAVKKKFVLTIEEVRKMWNMPPKSKESALERLNRPGWEAVYEFMKKLLERWEKQQTEQKEQMEKHSEGDWPVDRICTLHCGNNPVGAPPNLVLMGKPGTGKTTIARLIGEILRDAGILKRGHVVEVTRNDLTSSYVAGVPKATMQCVEAAEGGVLFIDEAHSLGKKDGGANHEGTGVEVVSTLCAAMTDPSRHFCVILAGYEEEMKEVFKLDNGFARRFDGNFIVLEDYKPELLYQILLKQFEEGGYTVDPQLLTQIRDGERSTTPLRCMVDRIYAERDRRTFGNADVMVRLAEHAKSSCRGKTITMQSLCRGSITEEWFRPASTDNTLEAILKEMRENYVGLEPICQMFIDLRNEIVDYLQNGKKAIDIPLRSRILSGNPGTGKTTVAKMLARLLYSLGVLGSPDPVILAASEFASSYRSGAIELANEKIREAQDRQGLIFIDEAHNLLEPGIDGRGVFKAFIAPVTDKEKPICVVFAVYPQYEQQLLALDNGGNRRYEVMHLEDYTGEQLFEILVRMMRRDGYQMSEEAAALTKEICRQIYRTRDEFTGNAGRMERILEEMQRLRRRRCQEQGISFSSPEGHVFLPEDIPEEYRREISAA